MTKTYIEPEEVDRMEQVAEYLRDRLLIRVLFWLGCRVSEAINIKVSDIDFESAIITIKHLKTRISLSCPFCGTRLTKTATFCPGCGKKVEEARERAKKHTRQRQVPIDRQTLDLLRYFIEQDKTKGLLFKVSRTQAWKIVHDLAEQAGLGPLVNPTTGKMHNVSPHKLRDAFATMAVKDDDSMDSVRALQEHLGHADIATTMKYRKLNGKEHRKWYDKLTKTEKQLTFPD